MSPQLNPLDVGRMLGGLWFAIGGVLLVLLGVLWGARPWPATLTVLAFLPTPLFVDTFAFLTPDRWVLVAGAGTLIAVTQWWRGSLAAPWLALVGVACGGLVKQTFILATFSGLLLMALMWFQHRRLSQTAPRAGRQVVTGMVWLLTGSAVGTIAWQVIKDMIGGPAVPDAPSDFLTLSPGMDSALSLLFHGAWGVPMNDSAVVALEPLAMLGTAALLTLLTAGAAWGALMYPEDRETLWPIAVTGVVAIGIGGLVIGVLGTISGGAWLPAAPRYVMPAFAAYVVPMMVIAGRLGLRLVLVVVAVTGALAWSFAPLL